MKDERGRDPYDINTWGPECQRGLRHKETGAPAPAGTKGVVRKISTGRKHRGLSSDDLAKAEARKLEGF
jgi:hypothetical protein